MNILVASLAKLLEPADRECVCGDLQELQLTVPAAAANILGLVIRRQLAEWSHARPWIALLCVAGLNGYFQSAFLAQIETNFVLQIRTYFHYGVAYEPGGVTVAQVITYVVTAALAALLWSWACGFVLASLSERTFYVTSFLFYCIVRDSWFLRLTMAGNIVLKHGLWLTMLSRLLLLDPFVFVFLCSLALGVRTANKRTLVDAA